MAVVSSTFIARVYPRQYGQFISNHINSTFRDADIIHMPGKIRPSTGTLFLLVLDAFHILIRHSPHINYPVKDIVTIIPLHHDLFAPARRLCNTATRRDCSNTSALSYPISLI